MRTIRANGFTLVEMAIVLVIVALLLGTSLTLISAQQEQQRMEETKTLLSDAREALIGYALSSIATTDLRPYLPCPDKTTAGGAGTANDGVEDRTAGACVAQEGNLPWVTLGLTPPLDPWSDRLRYAVTATFSNSVNGMQLTSTGNLNVNDAASGGNSLAVNVPAIILSHGKNGFGAINAAGISNPAPSGADELANTDGSPFVSHTLAPTGAAGGEFDDQVTWLSPNILFNRMVQAGRLP
ncbi:MAG: type II secretion system protein [Gallionella sp.]|jgi:prepilin-type N-terminal cleavage/methylation domain-containing protein